MPMEVESSTEVWVPYQWPLLKSSDSVSQTHSGGKQLCLSFGSMTKQPVSVAADPAEESMALY